MDIKLKFLPGYSIRNDRDAIEMTSLWRMVFFFVSFVGVIDWRRFGVDWEAIALPLR